MRTYSLKYSIFFKFSFITFAMNTFAQNEVDTGFIFKGLQNHNFEIQKERTYRFHSEQNDLNLSPNALAEAQSARMESNNLEEKIRHFTNSDIKAQTLANQLAFRAVNNASCADFADYFQDQLLPRLAALRAKNFDLNFLKNIVWEYSKNRFGSFNNQYGATQTSIIDLFTDYYVTGSLDKDKLTAITTQTSNAGVTCSDNLAKNRPQEDDFLNSRVPAQTPETPIPETPAVETPQTEPEEPDHSATPGAEPAPQSGEHGTEDAPSTPNSGTQDASPSAQGQETPSETELNSGIMSMTHRRTIFDFIANDSALLNKAPEGITRVCSNFYSLNDVEKKIVWVNFMESLAKAESDFKPQTTHRESFGPLSTGMTQISWSSARNHYSVCKKQNRTNCGCEKATTDLLKNSTFNLKCAVTILENQSLAWETFKTGGKLHPTTRSRFKNFPQAKGLFTHYYFSVLNPDQNPSGHTRFKNHLAQLNMPSKCSESTK